MQAAKTQQAYFACPFYKHDGEKYANSGSCAGRGWKDMPRLKEHLYRHHQGPEFFCQRCKAVFQTTDEEVEHVRRETACSFKEAIIDGLTSGQVNFLKSRTFGRGKTEKEKWQLVYGYLFPGDPIPSPYRTTNDNSHLETWIARLGSPNRVEELESIIHNEVKGRDANSLARKIIQHIQQDFFSYQETQLSSRSMPTFDIQAITGQAEPAISEQAASQADFTLLPSQDGVSFLSAPPSSEEAIFSGPPDEPQSLMVLPFALPHQEHSHSGRHLVTGPLTSPATAYWTVDRHGSVVAHAISSSLGPETTTVGDQSTLLLTATQLVTDTTSGDFSSPTGGSPIDFDFDTTDAYNFGRAAL